MHKIKKLTNGVELITIPMRGTKTATVLIMVGTGSKYENKDNNGVSHFLEHMFFKGTKKRSNTLAISGELDRIGGEYNAFTSKEYTGYWVKVESSQLELAIDVVSDMMFNSKFAREEIEREKGVIIEELNMYLDNPLFYIEDLFEQCLYGDAPAGWDTIGNRKNILKFKRSDLVNYWRSQYGSQNTMICIAGNFKSSVAETVNRRFNKFFKSNFKNKEPVKENQIQPQVNLYFKKTDQAHLSLGVRAYPFGHKQEMALKILSILLGGSMSSRLFTRLREREGLAYSVRTDTELYTDSGYLTTQAGVPINKTGQAIEIVLAEYKKLTKQPVNKAELDKVKKYLVGRIALQLELSNNVASWYSRQAVLLKTQRSKRKILSPENYYKEIKKIKAREIMEVARDIFTDNKLNLAVIGPYRDKKAFEKILSL